MVGHRADRSNLTKVDMQNAFNDGTQFAVAIFSWEAVCSVPVRAYNITPYGVTTSQGNFNLRHFKRYRNKVS